MSSWLSKTQGNLLQCQHLFIFLICTLTFAWQVYFSLYIKFGEVLLIYLETSLETRQTICFQTTSPVPSAAAQPVRSEPEHVSSVHERNPLEDQTIASNLSGFLVTGGGLKAVTVSGNQQSLVLTWLDFDNYITNCKLLRNSQGTCFYNKKVFIATFKLSNYKPDCQTGVGDRSSKNSRSEYWERVTGVLRAGDRSSHNCARTPLVSKHWRKLKNEYQRQYHYT